MKQLVAYFSATGTTKEKAEALADLLGAELVEITPKERYTEADLNWMDKKSRSSLECADENARPEITNSAEAMTKYDEVYIGFPIWWYTAPRIINSFIEGNDFFGTKVILFATSGGSGIARAVKDLRRAYPDIAFEGGVLLNGAVTKESIRYK